MHQFAEPGELLKEFEAEQERLRQEEDERKKEEEKASAELIAQFEKEQVRIVSQFFTWYHILIKFALG